MYRDDLKKNFEKHNPLNQFNNNKNTKKYSDYINEIVACPTSNSLYYFINEFIIIFIRKEDYVEI